MFRLLLTSLAWLAMAKKPNVVLMVIDDVGWADVGYHGSAFPTPNIDKLATEGVRLERLYMQQVCSPTRAALLTGRYPFRIGMQHRGTLSMGSLAAIPMEATTLAEALGKVGYRTHAIGKWHLGYASWANTPTGRGFESHVGYLQGQSDYYTHTHPHEGNPDPDLQMPFDFWRNRTAAKDLIGRYSMDIFMDEAKRVLDNHNPTEPLFMYFAQQVQHVPLQLPPEPEHSEICEHLRRGPDAKNRHMLCAMVNRLDKGIGDFVSMLKDKGMWENTLLWVMSDNGGMPAVGNRSGEPSSASNYPFRGGKALFFEGGVRAASFVTGGLVPPAAAGAKRDGLMHHVDVAATLAQLGQSDLGSGIDGINAWDVIAHGSESRRTEVPVNIDFSKPTNYSALIQGNWKLINAPEDQLDGWWYPDNHTEPTASQLPVQMGGAPVMLFDLATDPEERSNVAEANPDIVFKMLVRMNELADPANGYLDPIKQTKEPQADPALHDGCLAPWVDKEYKLGSDSIVV